MNFSKEGGYPDLRFEKEINIYGNEVILNRFQANETSIEVVQGKISAIISESELIELENSQATMYSKLASVIMDIDSLDLQFSELNTKYNTVSGQYTQLDSKMTQVEISVNGLSANVSQVSQNLSDNYSTTTQMNSAINAKANEITASVSGSYATKAELNTANGKISVLETWQNEASLKISDSYIISTVINSSSYQNSTDSLIEQKASSIRLKADKISWESTYSSMTEDGVFTCSAASIMGDLTLYKKTNFADIKMYVSDFQIEWRNNIYERTGILVTSDYGANHSEISFLPAQNQTNIEEHVGYGIIYSNYPIWIQGKSSVSKDWTAISLSMGISIIGGNSNKNEINEYLYIGNVVDTSISEIIPAIECKAAFILPDRMFGTINEITTDAANVRMGNSKMSPVLRCSSSSKRYKYNITNIDEELDPELLYNLPVRSFTYKGNYLSKTDRNYRKRMIGFIAEEVEEVYPKACQYNEDGTVEMWNSQILIPAMLALIQRQHKEIEKLKTTFGMNTLA